MNSLADRFFNAGLAMTVIFALMQDRKFAIVVLVTGAGAFACSYLFRKG